MSPRRRGGARVVAGDALRPPPGSACSLVFLDPPYGASLIAPSVAALHRAGWIAPGALLIAEFGREEALPDGVEPEAEWAHGAARMIAWRAP